MFFAPQNEKMLCCFPCKVALCSADWQTIKRACVLYLASILCSLSLSHSPSPWLFLYQFVNEYIHIYYTCIYMHILYLYLFIYIHGYLPDTALRIAYLCLCCLIDLSCVFLKTLEKYWKVCCDQIAATRVKFHVATGVLAQWHDSGSSRLFYCTSMFFWHAPAFSTCLPDRTWCFKGFSMKTLVSVKVYTHFLNTRRKLFQPWCLSLTLFTFLHPFRTGVFVEMFWFLQKVVVGIGRI